MSGNAAYLRERAIQMRAEGESWASIKATLGISQGRLQSFLKGKTCADCGALITANRAVRCKSCAGRLQGQAWTREAVRHAIAKFFIEHGRAPTAREWRGAADGRPSTSDCVNRFGSFSAAVRAAGLTPRPSSRGARLVGKIGGHRRLRPSVDNGDSPEAELAFLITEQERDQRFGHIAFGIPFDGNDFRLKLCYSDDWTIEVCKLLDRRAEIDAWAEQVAA